MALSHVSFLAQQLYSHRTNLARVASWCCLATSINSFVKDRFPRGDYFEVRGTVLLTTFIVMGLTFPYLWFNVAIGPVCFLVMAIYKMAFPPPPKEPEQQKGPLKPNLPPPNTRPKPVKVLNGGYTLKNPQLKEFPIPSIEARDKIELEKVACTGLVKSSKSKVIAHQCYLHRVIAQNEVELKDSNCNYLVLNVSGREGVIKLENVNLGSIKILGSGKNLKISLIGTADIPDGKIKFDNCEGAIDKSQFQSTRKS